MKNYKEREVFCLLKKILGKSDFEIFPIGNHNLGRHLVYRVELDNEKQVFKIYHKKNRRAREIATLNQLRTTMVPCPSIKSYGLTEDGIEWMLQSYLNGSVLDKEWNYMNSEQIKHVFYQLGDKLGQIHTTGFFENFGYWDENGKSIYGFKNYYTEFMRSHEIVFRQIYRQRLPFKKILDDAIEKIRNYSDCIQQIKTPRLTHHDYDGRNILVSNKNNNWKITGILDFEQSCPSNPEIDLRDIYARYFMQDGGRYCIYETDFINGYERHLSIERGFYDRLPFYLLCKGVIICSWTHKVAPEYFKEGIKLIEWSFSKI